jgi:hypothetical protein
VISDEVYQQIEKAYPLIQGGSAIIAPGQTLLITSSNGNPLHLDIRPDLVAAIVNSLVRGVVETSTAALFGEDYAKGRALAECFSYVRTQLDDAKEEPTETDVQNIVSSIKGRQSCQEAFSQSSDDKKNSGEHTSLVDRLKEDAHDFVNNFTTEELPDLAEVFADPLYR